MPPRILLVRFSSIGDIVLTTPVIRAIRQRHPDAHIAMVVREDMADLVRHNPRLDQVITWQHRSPLGPLVERIRQTDWTHRLDLHGSLRSRRLRLMVGGEWQGYPKHRIRRTALIATGRRMGGSLGHVVERYAEAAASLGITLDDLPAELFVSVEAEEKARAFLAGHGLGRQRRLVALVPGAAHFTKRWPPEYWTDLAARLSVKDDLVILGGPAEREVAATMVAAAGRAAASAAGDFSLLGSAALLRQSAAAVAGDTGLMHMATAVGTPVIALYGPGVEEFGFFPWRARSRVLQIDIGCRPCSAHGGPRCPLGHHRCLRDLTPELVAAQLERPPR
ncbi:MAG TPA: glycosyltransferase family 9 protein [Gemmatimonadales bacterium]|nr:glycosyltransferase family 9 protein [Gemmatimonadales bacterium]